MSDTARLCELLQAQAQLLSIRIAASETKEYKADWLKNTDTVVRDGSGRFAKKGTSSATPETPTPEQPATIQQKVGQAVSDTKKVTSLLLEGGEVSVEMLKKLLTDKNFRRRAGLEAGQTGAQAIKRLAEAAKVNPELVKKLDSYINKFNEDLIKEYGDDGGAMAQAMRKHGNLPPGKDLKERLELQVAKYKALEDALESPEFYEKEDLEATKKAQMQKDLTAFAVSIAVSFGIALVPEIIFAGSALSITETLIAGAAGEAGNWGVNTLMDKLEINNPIARLGIGLTVGSLAGGTPAMIFKVNRIKKAKEIGIARAAQVKQSLESVDNAEKEFEYMARAGELYSKINSTMSKKNIEDIDFAIEDFKYVLDTVKQKLKDPGERALKHSSVVPKVEKAIQELEKKKKELITIIEGKNTQDLSKLSKEMKALISKPKSNPKGFQALADNKAIIEKTNQQSRLVNEVKADISKYYQGWGSLYNQLEEAYRESAMALNRYHLDIDSKSLQYSDELLDSRNAKESEEIFKKFLSIN